MLAVRSNERAAAVGRHRCRVDQADGVRPGVVPRRPRRSADRLQPRPALAGVVRRVRRPQLPRHHVPRRASRASAAPSSPAPWRRSASCSCSSTGCSSSAPTTRCSAGVSLILTVILNPVGIAGKTRADIDAFRAKRAGASRDGGAARRRGDHRSTTAPTSRSRRCTRRDLRSADVLLRATGVSVTYGGLRPSTACPWRSAPARSSG